VERDAEIRERILRVLREALALNLREEEMAGALRLDELTGLDSMATLEFLLALEKEFGIRFDPKAIELDLLADLPRLVRFIGDRIASPDRRGFMDSGGGKPPL